MQPKRIGLGKLVHYSRGTDDCVAAFVAAVSESDRTTGNFTLALLTPPDSATATELALHPQSARVVGMVVTRAMNDESEKKAGTWHDAEACDATRDQ